MLTLANQLSNSGELTADKVPDNCVIVLLNDKYLKTLTQATKTLNAANSTKSWLLYKCNNKKDII